jgi:hypothetical protein
MMDYSALREQAENAIREVGQVMTLRVTTGGAVDHTGSSRSETLSDYQAQGVKRFYQEREIDNDLVLRGDLQVILAAGAALPEPRPKRDQLIIGSQTWDIEDCQPLAPGAETVLYKLQARR